MAWICVRSTDGRNGGLLLGSAPKVGDVLHLDSHFTMSIEKVFVSDGIMVVANSNYVLYFKEYK
jgi:hypothetical protein